MRISDWSSDVCSSDLKVARDRGDRRTGVHRLDRCKGFSPRRFDHLAAVANIRPVETATDKAVDMVARLVARPFLVNVLIDPRQHAQHLPHTRIDSAIGSARVPHVASESLLKLPQAPLTPIRLSGNP